MRWGVVLLRGAKVRILRFPLYFKKFYFDTHSTLRFSIVHGTICVVYVPNNVEKGERR